MAGYPEIDKATDEAIRRLKEMLERNVARALAMLQDESIRSMLARRGAAQLKEILGALGLDSVAAEYRDSFRRVAQTIGDTLELRGISAEASTVSVEAMQRFVNGSVGRLTQQFGEELPAALGDIIEAGSQTPAKLDVMIGDLSRQMQTTTVQAVVEADTRLMGFDRLVITEQSVASGFELFLYDGPDDGVIRPFCEEHVGKVWTLEELDAEDNGSNQPKPVSLFLGGYGCRHSLVAVTPEEAAAYGRR